MTTLKGLAMWLVFACALIVVWGALARTVVGPIHHPQSGYAIDQHGAVGPPSEGDARDDL